MGDRSGKKNHWKWFLGGVIATVFAIALLYFVCLILPVGGTARRPDSFQAVRKAKEIERVIARHYLGEINEKDQTDMMYVGQVAGLGDQYSRYYTKEQFETLQETRAGEYVGIGITFQQRVEDGLMQIMEVLPDSPAERAGLRADDLIVSVDGAEAAGMTSSEIQELIQAGAGTGIQMEILRGAENLTLTVVPDQMEIETVTYEMLDDAIGYIRITQFAKVTPDQYRAAYAALRGEGMTRLILDLRGNGGGLVESACDIAEEILPAGIIVYEEDKNGERQYHNCEGAKDFDCALAVLVNGQTASASEILTGAIQDYDIGTVVGEQTYGKGIVQNYYRLSDESVLQLTTTHYYTPDGNDIHESGITPDVEVHNREDSETDLQLAKAKRLLADGQ